MSSPRPVRAAWAAALFCSLASGSLHAAAFPEFVDPNPAPGNLFGNVVLPLSTGNVVITSPNDDAGGSNAGAVYLFHGVTGALISTLRGLTNDQVGSSGAVALTNGNFVVLSPIWKSGALLNVGAVTWGSGTTGVSGSVSAANSLVGSTAGDQVGGFGVVALSNGNYLVPSPNWDRGGVANAGAVTWGNGTTGSSGAISTANSLAGTVANDAVGSGGVTALTNGNYLVLSPNWDNVATANAGAATWGNGATGTSGLLSAANSLVSSTANSLVGSDGALALTNGNYLVFSANWDNGAITNVGAATWGNGTTGTVGAVSAANSLIGSLSADLVGASGATELTNGNYVVRSPFRDNGAAANAGAATWGNGATGVSGVVSAANSLIGSQTNDQVSGGGVVALANGHYVVASDTWRNGAVGDAGAVTWGNGTVGVTGVVSAANSLVGSVTFDQVGTEVTALSNGNYVVRSPNCNVGGIVDAGAVTWGSGVAGVTGVVTAANSLVGSTNSDRVGNRDVTALANGNFVVASPDWDNGGAVNAGAATWGSGTVGVNGPVSAANSLVGSAFDDRVGDGLVTALSNGNYVVSSPDWDHGGDVDAGAATWGNGALGVSGAVSDANSLFGAAGDFVGEDVTALSNGNYVVTSTSWSNGAATEVGAVTWGDGASGVTGLVSAANSLVGAASGDQVGSTGVLALSDGNYVVTSENLDNGSIVNAGAATWGDGTIGLTGVASRDNSLVGWAANTSVTDAVGHAVNGAFYSRFTAEGGGRVRAGPVVPFEFVSALDIPGDQGGWLRLSFLRHFLDHVSGAPAVATYGVWRYVPGTIVALAERATSDARLGAAPEPVSIDRMRAALPKELESREVGGRLFVMMPGPRHIENAATLPPGTWELVTSAPAVQQNQYVAAVPTINNATTNDYVVTAHTTIPSVWFITTSISGQSVDNLAPAQPTQLTAHYTGSQTDLAWAANTEPDLGSYSLHRGASAGFSPSLANRIASQATTTYSDVGPSGSYYKLAAVDVNGNVSSFALITPQATTDVNEGEPVTFAFHGVRPNPATGGGLHVAFALPNGDAARLELLDVSGRLVLARDVGALGAGRHVVNLAEGRRVRAGVYWVRLTQGQLKAVRRAAVVE